MQGVDLSMGLDPIVLFFALGLGAGILKADLRLPLAIDELVSTVLLLSTGMKGGIELPRQPADGLELDLFAHPDSRYLIDF